MTRTINLDQLRAEANHEPVEVHVSGRTFTLPAILPVSLALQVDVLAQTGENELTAVDAAKVFRSLVHGLAGDRADELCDLISLQELQTIITDAYGIGAGESSASVVSSPNGGMQPRPTSPTTTTQS